MSLRNSNLGYNGLLRQQQLSFELSSSEHTSLSLADEQLTAAQLKAADQGINAAKSGVDRAIKVLAGSSASDAKAAQNILGQAKQLLDKAYETLS